MEVDEERVKALTLLVLLELGFEPPQLGGLAAARVTAEKLELILTAARGPDAVREALNARTAANA